MQAQQDKWWLGEVEAAVARLIKEGADARKQEETWNWIEEEFEAEAAAYAARLFAETKWEAKPQADHEKARPQVDRGGVSFGGERAKSDDEPPILSKASPFDSAREFVARYWIIGGFCTTYYWSGHFWGWNGRCYEKVSADKINAQVWTFLDEAKSRTKEETTIRFRPRPADVEGVMKALRAGVTLNFDPPCWLDSKARADNVLVFKNGLVDIGSGKLTPLTPKLWVHHALDFEYDPEARCPTWEKWLGEVFQDDQETQDCIEEQLGLGMTDDIKFQKGFLWIGEQGREGKGTLAFVQEKLCGSTAYISLAFATWLRGEYSAEVMIGKKVGVFPDVRLKEEKWYGQNLDRGGLDHVSKEMLLKITGGDNLTFGRKYNPVAWQGVLPMKVTHQNSCLSDEYIRA